MTTLGRKQPIDQFVWQTMNRHGLQPNAEASPSRLIRRVALDLTGLPPTQKMVDRYDTNPNEETYSAIVDELLDDPAFGEHWASMWLDLARYADTQGYAGDEPRTIWPWRDWLIRSLNENKPYDQFTYEVLAGDLMPDATEQQILATAFHRNTLNNNEGGTNDEEFRTIAVKDRLSTTLNTWMGLTIRCAECHSHKYDPISHTEYYQLLDYFNQTVDDDQPDERPTIPLDDSFDVKLRTALDMQIALLKQQREQQRPGTPFGLARSFLNMRMGKLNLKCCPTIRFWSRKQSSFRQIHHHLALNDIPNLRSIGGLQIEMLPDAYHNGRVGRGPEGAFVLTQVQVRTGDQTIELKDAAVDFAQPGFDAEHLLRMEIADTDEPLGWAVYHKRISFAKLELRRSNSPNRWRSIRQTSNC